DACEHKRRYSLKAFNQLIKNNTSLKIVRLSYYNIILFLPMLVAALCYKLGSRKANEESQRTLFQFPRILNDLLAGLILADGVMTTTIPLPIGVNIFCILKKE
ncbi:hypothetical protein ACFL57_05800, partial [Candidatus Margulisiibacteriota bacterium]